MLLLLASCGQSDKKQISLPEDYTNDTALDSFFNVLYQKRMFNGAVAIKSKGKLIFKKGYGTANFSMDTPFLPGTAMEVASVSKQFTATAILLLEQEKKIGLDDNLKRYFGEDFPYTNITIKHLINHTSGLPDYESYFRKNWDTTKIATNSDIVAYLKQKKPNLLSEPGKKYKYSNSGYILLAEIVHMVSGKRLDHFLEEKIFKVAQMSNTHFYNRDDIWTMADYAPGYRIDPATCKYDRPENLTGRYYYYYLSGRLGPGRLSSNVEDLMKWDSILYTDTLLNAQGKEIAFQAYPAEEEGSDYGFGWHVIQDDSFGKVVYHTGSWAGNLAYIKRYVDDKSLVIILNNTYSPYIKEIRTAVDTYVMGGSLKIPKLKAVEVLKKDLCNLDRASVLDWYQRHSNLQWSKTDLKTLSKHYSSTGDEHNVALINIILENLNHEKNIIK